MGLPVARIMEEVEHELLHMNDEVDANIEVEEDADENMEVEEEVDDNMENDLDGITLEVVDGMKEGSRWLIVDDVHICDKHLFCFFSRQYILFYCLFIIGWFEGPCPAQAVQP